MSGNYRAGCGGGAEAVETWIPSSALLAPASPLCWTPPPSPSPVVLVAAAAAPIAAARRFRL